MSVPHNSKLSYGPNPGVWYRKGGIGQAPYYIWGPLHSGDSYRVFSDLSHMFDSSELVGARDNLDDAVQLGDEYLSKITPEYLQAQRPAMPVDAIARILQRLPSEFNQEIPEPIKTVTIRGPGFYKENVPIDQVAEIMNKHLVEHGQKLTIVAN